MSSPEVMTLSFALLTLISCAASAKEASSLVTREMREHAQRNIARYAWAKRERDAAARAAERYLKLSDEEIWRLVPGQSIPRAIHIHSLRRTRRNPGCPNCGEKIRRFGNYPYKIDIFKHPWKIQCPACGEFFPKNDFKKYYESGIGEGGVFHPEKADRSLLFNTEHPDPNDPKHRLWVDDGYGAVKKPRPDLFFIAYYCHWGLWMPFRKMAATLAKAYALTGDARYAHKAAVLLDRIADVYPSLNIRPYVRRYGMDNSDGGSSQGKAVGRIWEVGLVSEFARAIDTIWDGLEGDEELVRFLHAKAEQYGLPNKKASLDDIKRNLLDNIVRQIPPGVIAGQMVANEGGCQCAVATAAIVLDEPGETEKWLDWLFKPGGFNTSGHLPALIEGSIDRDGVGAEGSPSYSLGWSVRMGRVGDLLRCYPKYTKHDIYRDYPKVKQCFKAAFRMVCIGRYTPHIGDAGNCGGRGLIGVRQSTLLRGFQIFRDPFFAQAIYFLRRGKLKGLHGGIYEVDPEAVAKQIEDAVKQHGPFVWRSENMAGYGLTILRRGDGDDARAAWMYWGRSWGHGHTDRLNIGFFGKRTNFLPDLGYPEYTGHWPKRASWTDASISHNVVVVDEHRQKANWGGQQTMFACGPTCQVVEVKSENVYPQVKVYRRMYAMIDVSDTDSYLVDIFRVVGGKSHLYSFHAYGDEAIASGLSLKKQPKGTYAGEDVPFAKPYDGPLWKSTGFSYLYNVERAANPPATWSVDWNIKPTYKHWRPPENEHLRLTMLTPTSEVALAHGDPPLNKRGSPRRLRYVLAKRTGDDLRSVFFAVVEPYVDSPLIRRIERLPVQPDQDDDGLEAVCARIDLADGRVDYVMSSLDLNQVRRVGDSIEFAGRFVWMRTRGDQLLEAHLIGATRLRFGETTIEQPSPAYVGEIVDFDKKMGAHNCVYTRCDLPADGSLKGKWIHIENDGERDASYRIEGVRKENGLTVVDLGEVTFVRGYQDDQDYSKGLKYNFSRGDRFVIWKEAVVRRDGRK